MNDFVANVDWRSWQVAPDFFDSQFDEAIDCKDVVVEEPPPLFLNLGDHVSAIGFFLPRFGSLLASIGAALFGRASDRSPTLEVQSQTLLETTSSKMALWALDMWDP